MFLSIKLINILIALKYTHPLHNDSVVTIERRMGAAAT